MWALMCIDSMHIFAHVARQLLTDSVGQLYILYDNVQGNVKKQRLRTKHCKHLTISRHIELPTRKEAASHGKFHVLVESALPRGGKASFVGRLVAIWPVDSRGRETSRGGYRV